MVEHSASDREIKGLNLAKAKFKGKMRDREKHFQLQNRMENPTLGNK